MGKELLINITKKTIYAGLLLDGKIEKAGHINFKYEIDDAGKVLAIKKLASQLHFNKGPVSISASDEDVISKTINLESREKISDEFLEREFFDTNTLEENDCVYCYKKTSDNKIIAYSAERSVVDEMISLFKEAGLSLKTMIAESDSISRIIENSRSIDNRESNVFVSIDELETTLRIYRGSEFVTSCVLDNVTNNKNDSSKSDYSHENDYILQGNAIKKAIDYYVDKGFLNETSVIFLYGNASVSSLLVNYLKSETGLAIRSIRALVDAEVDTKYVMALASAYGACNCGRGLPNSENLIKPSGNLKVSPARIIGTIAFVLFAVAFLYFGVISRIAKTYELKNEYVGLESKLKIVQAKNEEYVGLEEEYLRFGNNYMTSDERTLSDRGLALDKVEAYLMKNSSVMKLSLNENEIATTLYGVDLAGASYITNIMMNDKDEIIDYVSTQTANNGSSSKNASTENVPSIEMKIMLKGAQDE